MFWLGTREGMEEDAAQYFDTQPEGEISKKTFLEMLNKLKAGLYGTTELTDNQGGFSDYLLSNKQTYLAMLGILLNDYIGTDKLQKLNERFNYYYERYKK